MACKWLTGILLLDIIIAIHFLTITKTSIVKIGNISEKGLVKDYESLEIFVLSSLSLSDSKLLSETIFFKYITTSEKFFLCRVLIGI